MAFFEMSWGGIRLWWADIETEDGRDLAVQAPATGNTADIKDQGDTPSKPVRCSLLFDQFAGVTQDAQSRLEDLLIMKSKSKGKPQLFVHPIYGAYLAYIGRLTHKIDSHGVITAEAEFIAAEDVGEVFTVDPISASLDVAIDTIPQTAAELSAELDALGLASNLPDAANAVEQALAAAGTAREKLVQVSQLSDRVWDEIDAARVAYDVATWPVFKAYVMCGDAARAAADRAAGGDAGAFMNVRIDAPTSLWRLLADIYGADEAEDRRVEAMDLNDIRTPGSISAGTVLRLRQPDARR